MRKAFLFMGVLFVHMAVAQVDRKTLQERYHQGRVKRNTEAAPPDARNTLPLPNYDLGLDSLPGQHSENGWYLSPHGTIRILVLFAEVEYDKNPGKDPQPNGADHWQKGQLPTWKDDLFDPRPLKTPKARVSRYYHDISLGDYMVLGDYIDRVFTLRESEYSNAASASGANAAAIVEASKMQMFSTAHGLSVADFDLWKEGGKPGLAKEPGPDAPNGFDHVMVILRNSSLTHGQGSTDPGSSGKLFGFDSDTQSRFGAMNGLPFEILKHEFNHLLLGGNNFHSGGGNASQFESYFICLQGGWSMMGAASSSLLTCSGWDRDRLGWRARNACGRINARDPSGACVNGDLDPLSGDTGVFVLRDFVTSGDALRIKLPYLGADEHPQWIWLENHQTFARNGSPTDRFHYEAEMPCVRSAQPGIFAALQVDRDLKSGRDIYGGAADYLRAIPATGFNDYTLRGDTVTYQCLWPGRVTPLVASQRTSNPLTGASELEIPVFDLNGDGVVSRSKEGVIPRVEERDGRYIDEAMFFGHARQAFTPQGNSSLAMWTDPALANMLTLVSTPGKDRYKTGKPNVRAVHLAGLSVKILEQRIDGSIVLRVRNDDVRVDHDVRWCADSIVLHRANGNAVHALHVMRDVEVTVDRSRTPTRIDAPEMVGGENLFSAPTVFAVDSGAVVFLETGARITLLTGSTLRLLHGAVLELAHGSRITADRSSRIVMHPGSRVLATPKQLRKLERKHRIVRLQ